MPQYRAKAEGATRLAKGGSPVCNAGDFIGYPRRFIRFIWPHEAEGVKEKMKIEKEPLLEQLHRWQGQELGTARALLGEVIELVEQQPEKEEEP